MEIANFNVEGDAMLNWALIFLVVALLAAVFGFTGIAVAAAGIAKLLFLLFLHQVHADGGTRDVKRKPVLTIVVPYGSAGTDFGETSRGE